MNRFEQRGLHNRLIQRVRRHQDLTTLFRSAQLGMQSGTHRSSAFPARREWVLGQLPSTVQPPPTEIAEDREATEPGSSTTIPLGTADPKSIALQPILPSTLPPTSSSPLTRSMATATGAKMVHQPASTDEEDTTPQPPVVDPAIVVPATNRAERAVARKSEGGLASLINASAAKPVEESKAPSGTTPVEEDLSWLRLQTISNAHRRQSGESIYEGSETVQLEPEAAEQIDRSPIVEESTSEGLEEVSIQRGSHSEVHREKAQRSLPSSTLVQAEAASSKGAAVPTEPLDSTPHQDTLPLADDSDSKDKGLGSEPKTLDNPPTTEPDLERPKEVSSKPQTESTVLQATPQKADLAPNREMPNPITNRTRIPVDDSEIDSSGIDNNREASAAQLLSGEDKAAFATEQSQSSNDALIADSVIPNPDQSHALKENNSEGIEDAPPSYNARPLQDVWPVQKSIDANLPSSIGGGSRARLGSESSQHLDSEPEKAEQAKGLIVPDLPLDFEKIAKEQRINAAAQIAMQSVQPARATAASVHVIAPRRARPIIRSTTQQPATREPRIRKQTEASAADLQEEDDPSIQQRRVAQLPASPLSVESDADDVVETEIGELPDDLWTLIDEPVPKQASAEGTQPTARLSEVEHNSADSTSIETTPNSLIRTDTTGQSVAEAATAKDIRRETQPRPKASLTETATSANDNFLMIQRQIVQTEEALLEAPEQMGDDLPMEEQERHGTKDDDQKGAEDSANGEIDISDLARQVYSQLRRQLIVERERFR